MKNPPNVYSIAAHRGFADALVAGLVPRYADPELGLARLTLLLPSEPELGLGVARHQPRDERVGEPAVRGDRVDLRRGLHGEACTDASSRCKSQR